MNQRIFLICALFAFGCGDEFSRIDDPRDYDLAEDDCDPSGVWAVTVSAEEDGECFAASSIEATLNISMLGDELQVEFENNSEFEDVDFYPGSCRLRMIRRFTIPETDTTYESRRFFDISVDFDGDTLTGTYDWNQSLYLDGSLEDACSQDLTLSGTR